MAMVTTHKRSLGTKIGQAMQGVGKTMFGIGQAQRMQETHRAKMDQMAQQKQEMEQQMTQQKEKIKVFKQKNMQDIFVFGQTLPSTDRKAYYDMQNEHLMELSGQAGIPWNNQLKDMYTKLPEAGSTALQDINRLELQLAQKGMDRADPADMKELSAAYDRATRLVPPAHQKFLQQKQKELKDMLVRSRELEQKAARKAAAAKTIGNQVSPERVEHLMSVFKGSFQKAANKFTALDTKKKSLLMKYVEANPLVGIIKEKLFGWMDPEIGGFLSARNAIAKVFVKATDGGRPTDFDFKIWVNKILPNLGVTDEVMQAKLDTVWQAMGKMEANTNKESAQRNFDLINNIVSGIPGTQEVRRKTKDGRIAIFDANTKEFIRYEE